MDSDKTVNNWTRQQARTTLQLETCLYCNHPTDDPISVGEDEQLCVTCLQDLREFGRWRLVDVVYYGGLEPATKRILQDHIDSIQSDLVEQYDEDSDVFAIPAQLSDATSHVTKHERDS